MSLSQDWTAELEEVRDVLAAVEQARDAAYAARDSLAVDLVTAGFTMRETGALLGISHQRVAQLTSKDWGDMPATTAADRMATAREAFHAAKHAQKLREERVAMGYKRETAIFYGDKDTPITDEQEDRIKWAGWHQGITAEAS